MSGRLLTVNGLLVVVAAALGAYVGWELTRPLPSFPTESARAAAPAGAAVGQLEMSAVRDGYGMIVSRNLFSPTRSDTQATAAVGTPAAQMRAPYLYGIVLTDGAPTAYLEDPVTKRVAGYRIGDAVAGGRLRSIANDGVVLARPEGTLDVRLRDPSKPRPAAPSQPPGAAGAAPQPGAPIPGVIPPATPPPPPQVQPPSAPPGQPGIPSSPVLTPGRRPLPPSLLRRFPQNAPGDATTR